jgi:hypothetical protein
LDDEYAESVAVFNIVGFAFNAPDWISIVPQIVSETELPAAVTLSGLQLNISGIIGPRSGWSTNTIDRSELCVCGKCRLFSRGDHGDPAVEASSGANKASAGELFLVVAALAGVGWTLSGSELWVAAQRAMPSWS